MTQGFEATIRLKRVINRILGFAGRFPGIKRLGSGILILGYHRVQSGIPQEMAIAPTTFRDQMRYLAEHYRVIRLEQAVEALRTPRDEICAVITFDDGYWDVYENGMPILDDLRLPATIFLATKYIEEQRPFPWDKALGRSAQAGTRPLTWAAVSEMLNSGLISVGSHTHSHLNCYHADAARLEEDIQDSVQLIRQRLGVEASAFCYPWGIVSPWAEQLVRRRFLAAVTGQAAINAYCIADPLCLARYPIVQSDDLSSFRLKLAGYLELQCRLIEWRAERHVRRLKER